MVGLLDLAVQDLDTQITEDAPGARTSERPRHAYGGSAGVVPAPLRKILVAVDGTGPSDRALDVAARLASQCGCSVALVQVVDVRDQFSPAFGYVAEEMVPALWDGAADLLDRAAESLPAATRVDKIVRQGDPSREIIAAADACGADLIVMGTRAGHGLTRLLLGSTADAVVHGAHCPVVTVV